MYDSRSCFDKWSIHNKNGLPGKELCGYGEWIHTTSQTKEDINVWG